MASEHPAGPVALVTGGSAGIGLATARRLRDEGAQVLITGRRASALQAALAELGPGVDALEADAGKTEDMARVAAWLRQRHGRLDILFANAGGGSPAPLGSIDATHVERVLGTNVQALVLGVQAMLPLMGEGAAIVLMSSALAARGKAGMSVYGAAKAAVSALTATWAVELAPRGIRVNAVAPGPVLTPGLLALAPPPEQAAMQAAMALALPLGRLGLPHEVANAVAFLASAQASFITGVVLPVDGGAAVG